MFTDLFSMYSVTPVTVMYMCSYDVPCFVSSTLLIGHTSLPLATYKFLTPNYALFLAAFFKQVIVSHVVVIGVVGGWWA